MWRWLAVSATALAVAVVQWILLAERIGHAFTMIVKLDDWRYATSVGRTATMLFWLVSVPALAAALYAYDKLSVARAPSRWAAGLAAVMLAAGCLVLAGMLTSDVAAWAPR